MPAELQHQQKDNSLPHLLLLIYKNIFIHFNVIPNHISLLVSYQWWRSILAEEFTHLRTFYREIVVDATIHNAGMKKNVSKDTMAKKANPPG